MNIRYDFRGFSGVKLRYLYIIVNRFIVANGVSRGFIVLLTFEDFLILL